MLVKATVQLKMVFGKPGMSQTDAFIRAERLLELTVEFRAAKERQLIHSLKSRLCSREQLYIRMA